MKRGGKREKILGDVSFSFCLKSYPCYPDSHAGCQGIGFKHNMKEYLKIYLWKKVILKLPNNWSFFTLLVILWIKANKQNTTKQFLYNLYHLCTSRVKCFKQLLPALCLKKWNQATSKIVSTVCGMCFMKIFSSDS